MIGPPPESVGPASLEGGFSSTTGLPPGVLFPCVLFIAFGAGFDPPRIFYFSGALRHTGERSPIRHLGRRPMGVQQPLTGFLNMLL